MFEGVRRVAGFNDPEAGFVWSQYQFAVALDEGVGACMVSCHYDHDVGLLYVWSQEDRCEAYDLQRGPNSILIERVGRRDLVQCEVAPRIQHPHDVRELGIMITRVKCFPKAEDCRSWLARQEGTTHLRTGTITRKPVWPLVTSEQQLERLYRYVLDTFIREGWASITLDPLPEDRAFLLNCAFYPPGHASNPKTRFGIAVNGAIVDSLSFQDHIADFPFTDIYPPSFLYLQGEIHAGAVGGDAEHLRIEVVDKKVGQPVSEWQAFFWKGLGDLPVPDAFNRKRVAGDVGETFFCLTGATWYSKLEMLVKRHMQSEIGTLKHILDWGCGCGRILRFFPPAQRHHVTGIDIDPVNIEWCKTNIPAATFSVVDTEPPTELADCYFDIIYGHSIFTHLTEEDQDKWLSELWRILKPGGFCFVTVNAELAWYLCYSTSRSPDQFIEYTEKGIRDAGHLDVGVDMANKEYYRNTTHTREYVWTHWSLFFDVIDIIDGFADFQSLVVLRKA